MKKNIIVASIMAAMLVPAAAQAQPGQFDRRAVVKQDQRSDRNSNNFYNNNNNNNRNNNNNNSNNRNNNNSGYNNNNNNKQAQQNNDWRRDSRYSNFSAPFSYQRFNVGSTMKTNYTSSNYRVNWDSRWNLPRAGNNQTYVRHYNDLLLVNQKNGKVLKVYRDLFRY